MSANFDALSAQALSLPLDQREALALRLWESVGGQVGDDAELIAEFDRRCAEMESDTVQTYSHEEVMRDAREAAGE